MNNDLKLPFPYALVSEDKTIIDHNNEFSLEFLKNTDQTSDLKLSDFTEDFNFNIKNQNIIIDGCTYRVYTSPADKGKYNVFFIRNNCCENCEDNDTAIGFVLIDNYTEVKNSIEETRFPHLTAVLDRKINEYFADMKGISRKFENDKYLFAIKSDKLDYLKESCLKLSENLSRIEMGNIACTISMGVGINGKSLSENMEFARRALDLALGRGGNQTIIKYSDDSYCFIGGDGDEVNSNSKVRARVKALGLMEMLMTASDVMIMGHKNPDLDSLGSAAGVFAIASFLGTKTKIVLNQVTSAVRPLYNRLIRDPKYNDVFIDNETAKKTIKKKTLLIIVDTHRPILCECPEIISKPKTLILFDHHRKSADCIEKPALSYHEAFASSTCELVTEMLMYIKGVKLTKTETEGLLAGITVDTKNFAFKTSSRTFEAAAYLKKCGADTISVRKLFKGTMEAYRAKTEVVCNAEIFCKNIAISVLKEVVENPVVLIAQAADEMLSIDGIEAGFVLYENDGKVLISARSLGKINVQKLMEKFGGGGHQTGAAAQVNDMHIDAVVQLIKQRVEETLAEK